MHPFHHLLRAELLLPEIKEELLQLRLRHAQQVDPAGGIRRGDNGGVHDEPACNLFSAATAEVAGGEEIGNFPLG